MMESEGWRGEPEGFAGVVCEFQSDFVDFEVLCEIGRTGMTDVSSEKNGLVMMTHRVHKVGS